MSDSLFAKDAHNKLKKGVQRSYRDFIEDLRHDFQRGFHTDVVDPSFLDQLNDIVHDEIFDQYSDLKFYWLNLVDNLIYVIQLHEDLLENEELDGDELTDLEEELFDFWNNSELAESFLNMTQEGQAVVEASSNLLALMESQIVAFYIVHLSPDTQEFPDALMYQIIPELGDGPKRIYLSDKHMNVDLLETPTTYPSIPVTGKSEDENKLTIEVNEKDSFLKIENKFNTPLTIDGNKLYVIPQCEEGEKSLETFKTNIQKALANIKKAAPHLFDTFASFTNTIVPINEKGIVSYSMQSLPGYSCLNMFDRDQIDLMDDLLHENGHHYLNTYLNQMDLINEDDDKIYYSPWRKALRPIRGIYHAVFTFYWAMELFACLSKAIDEKVLTFNAAEVVKIKKRFIEEYYMLDYCRADLKHAFKVKKVNKDGMNLIDSTYARIDAYKNQVEETLKELNGLDSKTYQEVLELKNHLGQTRAHYKLV